MEEGAVTRDIYLPEGLWRDMNTGLVHDGLSWLRDYPAPLDTLPYFESALMSGSTSLTTNIFTSMLIMLTAILLK